jgi:hypothetical protein
MQFFWPRISLKSVKHMYEYIHLTLREAPRSRYGSKTLYKKTVQHNVDEDILTKQCFPRAHR